MRALTNTFFGGMHFAPSVYAGDGTISGTLTDDNGAVAYGKVSAHERKTRALCGHTVSNLLGVWSISHLDARLEFIIVATDPTRDKNAARADMITPV